MSYKRLDNLVIEGARLIFKNFAGEESKFNRKGDRNFCVVINGNDAEQLARDGWNVRELNKRDDEEPLFYLPVCVRYNNMPPKITLVSGRNKTNITEDTVDGLDYAEIVTVDLILKPYSWDINGKTGVKAYLKNMYVVVEVDQFADKYDFEEDDDMPF